MQYEVLPHANKITIITNMVHQKLTSYKDGTKSGKLNIPVLNVSLSDQRGTQ